MTDLCKGTAAEINHHHTLARQHAAEAIHHAFEAGRLLFQVKQQLMHGEWTAWLAANVDVSERQAQRYMRAAAGKPLARRASKPDTVSLLTDIRAPRSHAMAPEDYARWTQLEIPNLYAGLL